MLTAETKRRIQSARDILVGQLPLPTDQVELITIALIYKFMDDIDEEARSIGGRASFFTGDLRDLSWRHIISNTLSADARVIKLTQGIEAISDPKNTQIPELFKSIFRNAFLKFRDGRTLKLFLDEINGFTYDHSEELGNAFEFILESMGVQADNGQFRTPRNIIEFIVDVVDPQKDETILDPACGTAGFLISAYKHILEANTSVRSSAFTRSGPPEGGTPNIRVGDLLKGNQRDKLTRNVVGYDITPLMCRLSRVNMYLHHFSNPVIHEYNTLANKNRWDDKFDVILANPPFMTPKGGIRPHDRFAISANRSEVLFVDYIAEHLNPAGRAGIIVPEGIIFQSQNAYKELRRMLVDGFLWAVVSLPAGVFNPYSGVKTSILFLDRALAKQNDEVLFVKVENDGFGLGAQRREIELNDFPEALEIIQRWKRDHKVTVGKLAHAISRKRILESSDTNLSGDRYRAVAVRGNDKWPMVKLGEVCEINPSKSELNDFDKALEVSFVPMSAMGENQPSFEAVEKKPLREVMKGYTYFRDRDVLFAKITPCFENGKAGIARGLNNGIGFGSTEFVVLRPDNKRLLPELLYFFIASEMFRSRGVVHMTGSAGQQRVASSFVQSYKIPLPPMAEQERLVAELEGYRRVIESARQILAHYKPTLRLNPKWPLQSLDDLATLEYGLTASGKDAGNARLVRITDINEDGMLIASDPKFIEMTKDARPYLLEKDDVLVARTGATYGKTLLFESKEPAVFASFLIRLRFKESVLPRFYWFFAQSDDYWNQAKSLMSGGGQPQFNGNALKKIIFPVPPLAEQRAMVAELETERALVEANRELALRFEQKLQTKLSEIWGAPQIEK